MLEAPLRDLLAQQISVLDDGLELLSTEKYIPSTIGTRSFIDLLARDKRGRWVLIELKRSNAAAREAIHEVYKYVEAVKDHLRARDDEIRAIIVSTEWKELLVPFSRFVQDTSISVSGAKITLSDPNNLILAEAVEPLATTSGRVLSPWHKISFYSSEERLAEGVTSYDSSCQTKGIDDYIMLEMKAPEGFYDASVLATADSIKSIHGGTEEPTEEEIADVADKMERLDHLIYFVPQLQSEENYLKIISADPPLYEEVKEFMNYLEGEELLSSLQEYALEARPKVDSDNLEIGYPAKFQNKLLDSQGWTIVKIHRRGAFARNKVLSNETILGEIAGEAGTSGQRLKRSIILSDKAEFIQLLKDVAVCLPNNPVWIGMIRNQLEEARADFPDGAVDASIFSPSTGMLTLFFAVTRENGILYVPSYSLSIIDDDDNLRRMYAGELMPADDAPQGADAFIRVLSKYYEGDLFALIMSMTWGGYETRDIDVLEDLGLIYGSFRCDAQHDDRQFYRMKNGRWRSTNPILPFGEFNDYLERNDRLLRIIVNKLSPRIGPGICDGSCAVPQLENAVNLACVKKGKYHNDPPEECDICSIPISGETFISDGRMRENTAWANMCADCTVYFGAGIGWGVGQLYRNEGDGRWLLVAGSSDVDADNE